MRTDTNNKNKNKKSKRIITVAAAIGGILVIAFFSFFGYCKAMLKKDVIYNGIYVLNEPLGGLSKDEAAELINEKFALDGEQILTLRSESAAESFKLSEISPTLDAEKTANDAYSYARYGSVFGRIKKTFKLKSEPYRLSLSINFNDEALKIYTDKLTEAVGTPMQDISAELSGTVLTVTPGISGEEINFETAKAAIAEKLSEKIYDVTLSLEEAVPQPVTAEEIHKRFSTEAKDASYELTDGEIHYIDEQNGVFFEKSAAKEAIDGANGGKFSINVTVTPPTVTVSELKSKMFRDKLATYSSKYSEAVSGRAYNVKLAAKYINGTILLPGDVFSYNTVVGPRTSARGFKEANVYVGDQVEKGIGGGICQVSSTLFNTVVMADLNIVTRTSHSLPVSYVPAGRDATVSYGSIDFKFSNSLSMPVKIVASASGGVNTVTIYGTKDNKNRSVSFETELLRTIPYEVKQTEDSSLPAGTVKVETKGVSGSSYNTYKVVYENGVVSSRTLLTKSTYNPTAQKEIIGTGEVKAASAENSEAQAENTPNNAPVNTQAPTNTENTPSQQENTVQNTQQDGEKPKIKPVSPAAE